MGKLRFLFALWIAKLSIPALKITHHNGTDFPGSLATKLCPDFLKYVEKPHTLLAVTGTNGKTTVANMMLDILEGQGKTVLNNRAGSNIRSGISTAFIYSSNLLGKLKNKELGILEIDERSAPRIYPYVKPDYILVTNLFRDSIMRNAHPAYIAEILSRYIPKESKLILNADELLCATLCSENNRVYYGIDQMPEDTIECENLLNDVRICPKCASPLQYIYRKYHHLGHASCPHCGFESPKGFYLGQSVNFKSKTMLLYENGTQYPYTLIADNLHNVYNMVSVIAGLRQLGLSHDEIAKGFQHVRIPSTRQNIEQIGPCTVIMQMSKDKNALACSRNFDYIRSRPGKKELLLMMNCLGVAKSWSENPSWLYDTDFEFLNSPDVDQYVCTGPRCLDYKLRLLYAGIPEEKIAVEPDEFRSLSRLHKTPGEEIYILYGVDGMPLAFRVKAKLKEILEKECAQ